MPNVLRAGPLSIGDPWFDALLGNSEEPIAEIDARSRVQFRDNPPIVWECDARTFTFGYVGSRAEELLGHRTDRWLQESFWAEHIVHDDDRDDAVSYCALATAKARDHMFEYRARGTDGRCVWLRDYVKVLRDDRGRAIKLRGAMFDVTREKENCEEPARLQEPTRAELVA